MSDIAHKGVLPLCYVTISRGGGWYKYCDIDFIKTCYEHANSESRVSFTGSVIR